MHQLQQLQGQLGCPLHWPPLPQRPRLQQQLQPGHVAEPPWTPGQLPSRLGGVSGPAPQQQAEGVKGCGEQKQCRANVWEQV
jgi:hypothetical protein